MKLFFSEINEIRIEHKLDSNFTYHFVHAHPDTAELYYFINGIVNVHIEGNAYLAEKGDVFLIRPNEAHHFEISPEKQYERIVINFNPDIFSSLDKNKVIRDCLYNRKAGEKNKYSSSDLKDTDYNNYFANLVKKTNSEIEVIANLLMILSLLSSIFHSDKVMETPQNDTLDSEIIRFVNDNLENDLAIDFLCQRFYISPSKITAIFKKNTGMTPGKYITAKRLYKARGLILNGHKPSKIYHICGFNDYSTFYRSYTKQFGISPAKEKSKMAFENKNKHRHSHPSFEK